MCVYIVRVRETMFPGLGGICFLLDLVWCGVWGGFNLIGLNWIGFG